MLGESSNQQASAGAAACVLGLAKLAAAIAGQRRPHTAEQAQEQPAIQADALKLEEASMCLMCDDDDHMPDL